MAKIGGFSPKIVGIVETESRYSGRIDGNKCENRGVSVGKLDFLIILWYNRYIFMEMNYKMENIEIWKDVENYEGLY